MDEQQRICSIASSSNSSSMVSSKKYDVFLSFRGEDTRRNFLCHLYAALNEEKVETYIDDQLKKGDEISPALIKAIEDSRVSIVIFSENYASSKWCLGELSKILECKKVQWQIVMPVFYNIDASHVRKQAGSYEQAFAKHEGDLRCNEWKAALIEAANLVGWDSGAYRTDIELLKDIVRDVLQKLPPRYRYQHKGLVGIMEHGTQIESLLKIGSSEIMTLGIWGMGGIGKTTIAKALYDKLSDDFEGRCFLTDVREKSNMHALCDELFAKLLGNKNHSFDYSEMRRLQGKKYFIVLDDVATLGQLEKLIVEHDFLGPGSRVIVTTRNKQIFGPNDEIYQVKGLGYYHSLKVFCLTVFGEKQPKDGYEYLSRRVINYCQGIPLALKVLGASLRSRSKEAWESELTKLQEIPNMEIHNVLKLSYDGIDRYQQDIFLDIACFFKGETRDYVTSALEAFRFFPASGIEVLLDKALITISYDNKIEMHDLIQEMGQEIVHQESTKNPGGRSRLWEPNEVHDVLRYNRGTDVVEGLSLDLSKLTGDLHVSFDSLAKMTNLRFIKIHEGNRWGGNRFNLYLTNGLELLFDKLRYLHWDKCCLESFPSNFCSEQLVELHMRNSNLKELWLGTLNLVNLKKIDLSYSREIERLNVDSKCLRELHINGCSSLNEIALTSVEITKVELSGTAICALPTSMLSLPKLTCLQLRNCKLIESLNLHSKSLRELCLGDCSSLKEITLTSDEMTKLELVGTAICSFSSSMLSLPKLTYLDLTNCKVIESLILHSKSLRELYLDGCSSLKEIALTSEEMTELELSGTTICALSSSMISLPNLTCLNLRNCKVLESLNLHSKSLKELYLGGCSSLKEIVLTSEEMTKLELLGTATCSFSSSMLSLPKLTYLDLSYCRVIESLNLHSKALRELYLVGCSSLKEISVTSEELIELDLSGTAVCALSSSLLSLPKLTYLDLSYCKLIESLNLHSKSLKSLSLIGCSSLKEILVTSEEMIELDLFGCRVIESLSLFSKPLKLLRLNGCSSLKEISVTSKKIRKMMFPGTTMCALPSSIGHLLWLEVLDLSGSNVESLPTNIKDFSMLRELNLKGFKKLMSLPEFPPSLRVLRLNDCKKLVSLPELPTSLSKLYLDNCKNLVSLPEVPPTLYVVSAFNCISLETEITQQLVLQHLLHQHRHNLWVRDYFIFPGDHVTDKCWFRTTESSVTIPCLPISHVSGFIYCIVLSKGSVSLDILVSIYQDDMKVWDGWDDRYTCCENPISEHVIFWYDDISKYEKTSEVYDLSRDITFIFNFVGDKESIKGFGVFPVYATTSGFKLEIFESESTDQEQLPASKRRRT